LDILVWITTSLLVISKFLDCLTTTRKIQHPNDEQNLIARKMMQRFGMQPVIWGIFGIALLIVGVSHYGVFLAQSMYYSAGYIGLGLLLAVIQFLVAYTNQTGKVSRVIRMVRRHLLGRC
jgi:hypothetical protein